MGIVAKNAILLIEFLNWFKERGTPPHDQALTDAGRVRLRPILMICFALVAGMTSDVLGTGEEADCRAPTAQRSSASSSHRRFSHYS